MHEAELVDGEQRNDGGYKLLVDGANAFKSQLHKDLQHRVFAVDGDEAVNAFPGAGMNGFVDGVYVVGNHFSLTNRVSGIQGVLTMPDGKLSRFTLSWKPGSQAEAASASVNVDNQTETIALEQLQLKKQREEALKQIEVENDILKGDIRPFESRLTQN